jgi:hypothetical protein
MNFKEGRGVPHVAFFTHEAKAEWMRHFNAHASEMNGSHFPPSLRGPWGKLREYAGRLTLILACLDNAADPTANPNAVPVVDPRTVRNAWRLVSYFKSHARRVYSAIGFGSGVGGGSVVKAIVAWVRDGRRSEFSERDIKQARRWIEEAELADALNYLVMRNAIRPREAPAAGRGAGRPASPIYDVNPALLDSQNTQNTQNGEPGRVIEDFEHSEFAERGA